MPNFKAFFEGMAQFGELPAGVQVVLLIGAVAVLVLGGMFLWRVVRTLIGLPPRQ